MITKPMATRSANKIKVAHYQNTDWSGLFTHNESIDLTLTAISNIQRSRCGDGKCCAVTYDNKNDGNAIREQNQSSPLPKHRLVWPVYPQRKHRSHTHGDT